jgi:UDPglucose 6-dehydrogenase
VNTITTVSVIGTGYLGATHAACMAELGFDVVGLDNDPAKVAMLAAGRLPFVEPDLEPLLAEHVATGRLRFTTDPAEAAVADVHFLCVGTPSGATAWVPTSAPSAGRSRRWPRT